MTFSKMMEAGKERKDAIKAAMLVKMAAIQQGETRITKMLCVRPTSISKEIMDE